MQKKKIEVFVCFLFLLDFADFDEVLIDLVPKVAQILQKVAQNPWGFGFGLIGPSL